MVSSKMDREAERHRGLSQPALSRSEVGEHMQAFAEQHDIMTTPRRALIDSNKGDKILLGTPWLKFCLDEGLVVTCVHMAVQCCSHPWLKPFADSVSTFRRAADTNPDQKILGETAKLVGNADFAALSWTWPVTRKSCTSKWPAPSTVSSFKIWKN